MGTLADALIGHTRLGLDTSVFIYHLERHPRYFSLTYPLLAGVEASRWSACTSVVTLMELTARPWQLGQPEIAQRYETALTQFPNLMVLGVTPGIAHQAAQLRAQYRLRPADALQFATALLGGATLFVTNDRDLTRVTPVLPVLVLEDLDTTSP
ncbi:MAG TPA: PIN domain-containing protein [Anaerolineae bacterium]|nr:PIN domain-containing protein [Anaerolineae bacterium]